MMAFTKEELQIILLDMNTYIRSTPMLRESPSHKELRDKIELMIDNYCEHDWVQTYTEREVCRCAKCDEESL